MQNYEEKMVTKLDDECVSAVVGGLSYRAKSALEASAAVTAIGMITTVIPSGVGAAVCMYKAKRAQEKGRTAEAQQLLQNFRTLTITEGVMALVTTTGSVIVGFSCL